MQYEIKGGSFPVVVCKLQRGDKMIAEKGSMVWMSPTMKMETKGGGLGKMFGRALSGDTIYPFMRYMRRNTTSSIGSFRNASINCSLVICSLCAISL